LSVASHFSRSFSACQAFPYRHCSALAKTDFRERGKLKKASRIELSIRRFAALATKGDVASAAWLLKIRAHAKKYGDTGPTIIRVAGGFPEAFR
jgi:hypothetical protein